MHSFPLEYAIIEFRGNKFSGTIVPELLDLAERGIVRFADIVFIQKDEDGTHRTVELNDLDDESYQIFVPIGTHVAGLFSEEDLELAASKLPNNSSAMLILWENLWAEHILKAIADSDGVLVESGRIPAEVVDLVKEDLAVEA